MTISGTTTPADQGNYYCIPPSNDPATLGIWQDVENGVQVRGRVGYEAVAVIRDETGTYVMSIGPDGAIRWWSGKAIASSEFDGFNAVGG